MSAYRPIAIAAAGVVATLVFSLAAAGAAELRLTSTIGVKAVVQTLAPEYERATGNKLTITWGIANVLKGKLESGAPFDVTVLTGDVVDALVKDGKIATASRVEIARSGVGVGVRAGTPKPDIASVAAFKSALLAAKSVCYSKKGASGVYAASLMERLGIAAAMRPKTLLATGPAEEFLLDGKCALSIQQVSEIVPVSGIELVGPVPAELQTITAFAAGVAADATPATAAAADGFIKFLTSPAAAKIITANGMKPG